MNTTTKSTSETGHAKNIAHFLQLISFCEGYEENYNPIKETLKIIPLKELHNEAQERLNITKTQKVTFDNATNNRRVAFADLKQLSTKIINALSVSGADTLSINNAKSINKKIQGKSNKSTNSTPDTEATNTISTSQQSYDKQIDNFSNLIEILQQQTSYTPNEAQLKIDALQTKLQDLQNKNTNVTTSYIPYSNAMLARNETLYNPLTGLVQTAKEVKQYVKSVYGPNSKQYKQISALEFKKIKKY